MLQHIDGKVDDGPVKVMRGEIEPCKDLLQLTCTVSVSEYNNRNTYQELTDVQGISCHAE